MVAVAVACADSGSGYPRCPSCKDADFAKHWGCHEPAAEPAYWIECIWCKGLDDDCTRCHGEGRIAKHRCPNVVATQELLGMVSAVALVEQGVLPEAGGWNDQPSTFCQAHPIVANSIAKERELAVERAQKKAQKQQQRRR